MTKTIEKSDLKAAEIVAAPVTVTRG